MSDERPRPQYGEYATPEEQSAAIQSRMPEAPPDSATATQHPQHTPGGTGKPPAPATAASEVGRTVAPTAGSLLNRYATLFLLAMGLISLLNGIGGYLNVGTLIDATYEGFGQTMGVTDVGSYAVTELTGVLGWVLLIAHTIVWTLAAYYSFRRLRVWKTAWWIPLLGAVAIGILTMIVMFVLVTADPAFQALVATTQ